MKFYDSVGPHTQISNHVPYVAMQACLSEHILHAGGVVGSQRVTSLAGWVAGNRFVTVVLCGTLDRANNTLATPVHLWNRQNL